MLLLFHSPPPPPPPSLSHSQVSHPPRSFRLKTNQHFPHIQQRHPLEISLQTINTSLPTNQHNLTFAKNFIKTSTSLKHCRIPPPICLSLLLANPLLPSLPQRREDIPAKPNHFPFLIRPGAFPPLTSCDRGLGELPLADPLGLGGISSPSSAAVIEQWKRQYGSGGPGSNGGGKAKVSWEMTLASIYCGGKRPQFVGQTVTSGFLAFLYC